MEVSLKYCDSGADQIASGYADLSHDKGCENADLCVFHGIDETRCRLIKIQETL